MIVVCTDISPMGSIKGHQGLTLNKKYEVVSDIEKVKVGQSEEIALSEQYYQIINDDGLKCSYRKKRFEPLDKFRESKIEELGI